MYQRKAIPRLEYDRRIDDILIAPIQFELAQIYRDL
jgi:hypothetical protein